jgi:hypothetical protein
VDPVWMNPQIMRKTRKKTPVSAAAESRRREAQLY